MVPIVLVHGIRANAGAWATFDFGHAVDLPGHGSRLGGTFTMPDAVSVITEAIDALGGGALVVGHSLGGYVAMAAAAADPSRVAGLVIAGSTAIPSRLGTAPFLVLHKFLSSLPDGGDGLTRRLLNSVLPPDVAASATVGPFATTAMPSVVAALRSFDPLDAVSRYTGPTWFINGGHDHLRLHERKFLAAARDARLIVIPGAGHYLPMTHPKLFARHVRDIAAVVESKEPL